MTIEQELRYLAAPDGFIRPRTALEWARSNPNSELHSRLEWDDGKAADAYRLEQVRYLIRVHFRTEEGQRTTMSLLPDRRPEGGYRFTDFIMSNEELRAQALRQALAELNRVAVKYQYLSELANVFAAIRRVEKDNPPPPPPPPKGSGPTIDPTP